MDFILELPPVTRAWIAASLLMTALCAMDVITPFHLYYNYHSIFVNGQAWRLVSNFLFFGSSLMDVGFHLYFLVRYSRGLEEGYGRGRSLDFLFLVVSGGAMLMAVAPFLRTVYFFGSPLTFMLVYLWSRRNPGMQIALLGLVHFSAPWLPWALLGFSLLLGHDVTSDALGIAVGHAYFFLEDVWPHLAAARGWRCTHVLPSPSNLAALWRRCCARRGAAVAARAAIAPPVQPVFDNVAPPVE